MTIKPSPELPEFMGFPEEQYFPASGAHVAFYRCHIGNWYVYVWGDERNYWFVRVIWMEPAENMRAVGAGWGAAKKSGQAARLTAPDRNELTLMAVIHELTSGGNNG